MVMRMGEDQPPGVAAGGWIDLVDHVTSASAARAAVADACRRWCLPELIDTATLLVSELVTNALHHGQPPLGLHITRRAAGLLHIEVADSSPDPPTPDLHPDTSTPGGRGLFIVESLAARWGYRPDGQGKRVWFELDGNADA